MGLGVRRDDRWKFGLMYSSNNKTPEREIIPLRRF
jgi:hypothetical protein